MPYLKKFKERGSVDTITIIGVLFLLVTLSVATYVAINKDSKLNIGSRAKAIIEGVDIRDPELQKSIKEVKQKQKEREEKEDDNSEQQQAPATTKPKFADGCSVNGSNLSIGSKVIGGANIAGTNTKGSSGYAICDANLGWIDCPSCDNNSLTTLPTYVKTELENTCINNGNTWDSLSNTCITQNTTTPITISQNSNTGYVSLSDSVRDVQVQQNNIQYQQQTTNTNNKNSGSLNNIKTGGGTKSLNNTNTNTILPYVPISYSQINNIVKNMPGMEWYNYITSQNTSTSDSVKTFKTNLVTDTTLNKNVNINTLTQSINSENPTNLNDNNFGTNCGKPGLSAEERAICTDIARVVAYNSPITGDFIQSYSPQNVTYNYKQMGYDSLNDCVNNEQTYIGKQQCNGYQITKDQATASIDLGTDIASVITLPVAPLYFGYKSLLMFGFGTFGSTMTAQQTKNAVVAQIEDPGFFKAQEDINPNGFWETINPQTYLTDAGYQTTMAGLGWMNLSTADQIMKAWGPTGNAVLQQSARVKNTVVSGANLFADAPYAVSTCTEVGFFTTDCAFAGGTAVADIIFGGVDAHQGQLTLNPIRAVTETVDSVIPSLININGLANNPLNEIQLPTRFNNTIPMEIAQAITPKTSTLDLTPEGQTFLNQNTYGRSGNVLYDTEGSPERSVLPAWFKNGSEWIAQNITQPVADATFWRNSETQTSTITRNEPEILFAPNENPATNQEYLTNLGNSVLENINEGFSNFWQNNVYSWTDGFLPQWTNVGTNPIANAVFGNPRLIEPIAELLPPTRLIGKPEDISLRPSEVVVNVSNESPWQSINRTETKILNDNLPIKGNVVDLPQSNPETGLSTAIIYRSPQEGRVTVYRGIGDPETIFDQTASLLRSDPNNADLRVAVQNFADNPSPETFNSVKQLVTDPEGMADLELVERNINRYMNEAGLTYENALAYIHVYSSEGFADPGRISPYLSATSNLEVAAGKSHTRNGGIMVLSVPEKNLVRFDQYFPNNKEREIAIKTALEPDEIVAFIPIRSSVDINPRQNPDFNNDLANASQYVESQAWAITRTNPLSLSAGVWDFGAGLRESALDFLDVFNAPREIPEGSIPFAERVSHLWQENVTKPISTSFNIQPRPDGGFIVKDLDGSPRWSRDLDPVDVTPEFNQKLSQFEYNIEYTYPDQRKGIKEFTGYRVVSNGPDSTVEFIPVITGRSVGTGETRNAILITDHENGISWIMYEYDRSGWDDAEFMLEPVVKDLKLPIGNLSDGAYKYLPIERDLSIIPDSLKNKSRFYEIIGEATNIFNPFDWVGRGFKYIEKQKWLIEGADVGELHNANVVFTVWDQKPKSDFSLPVLRLKAEIKNGKETYRLGFSWANIETVEVRFSEGSLINSNYNPLVQIFFGSPYSNNRGIIGDIANLGRNTINITANAFTPLPTNLSRIIEDIKIQTVNFGININGRINNIIDPRRISLEEQYRIALDAIGYGRDTYYKHTISELHEIDLAYMNAGLEYQTLEALKAEVRSKFWSDILPTKQTFMSLLYGYDFSEPILNNSYTKNITFTSFTDAFIKSETVEKITRITNPSSPVLVILGTTVGGYQYWENYVSDETKHNISDFWQNITSPILNLFDQENIDNRLGKGINAILPAIITPTIENPEYKNIDINLNNNQQPIQENIKQRPANLTSTGDGVCQRIDRSNPCDGERMYDLYLWYKNQPNEWWNEDGDFTPADFLSLMLLAEAKGSDPEFLKAITTASSSQLWGSNSEHKAYCTDPECEAGIFNFIGAYMEVGTRRYNAIIADPVSNNDLDQLIKSDQQNANYFAQNGITIDQIGDMTINNPVSTVYTNDVPTHWGNFGCGENCDYLGDNWLQNAGKNNIKVNTTDRCGIYDLYGQGGVMAVVYTNNQKYNWSLPDSPCFKE